MKFSNKNISFIFVILFSTILLLILYLYNSNNNINIFDIYPKSSLNQAVKDKVSEASEEIREIGHRSLDYGMGPYKTYDKYIYFRDHESYQKADAIQMDENGFPKVLYTEGYFYNAVSLSQYAFRIYADYLDSGDEKLKDYFLRCADFLITLQDKDGAFRYPFEWYNYNSAETYPVGWVSSMAQGHALSVYARAYHLTKDQKYIENGNKVFDFTIKDKEKGGTLTTLEDIDPSYKDHIFFEEYISTPNSYTLNGYIFTLFGIYDWATIDKDYPELKIGNKPSKYFYEGIESLKLILPLYDIDGMSSYDLGHITYKNDGHVLSNYHSIHIVLLSNLYSITGENIFYDYQRLWTSYLDKLK